MNNAEKEYREFCNLFDNIEFSSVDSVVGKHGLSYGAEKPQNGNGVADINYKSILGTVIDNNGCAKVSPKYEVYSDDGMPQSVVDDSLKTMVFNFR